MMVVPSGTHRLPRTLLKWGANARLAPLIAHRPLLVQQLDDADRDQRELPHRDQEAGGVSRGRVLTRAGAAQGTVEHLLLVGREAVMECLEFGGSTAGRPHPPLVRGDLCHGVLPSQPSELAPGLVALGPLL